jgi:hypothetical protein
MNDVAPPVISPRYRAGSARRNSPISPRGVGRRFLFRCQTAARCTVPVDCVA